MADSLTILDAVKLFVAQVVGTMLSYQASIVVAIDKYCISQIPIAVTVIVRRHMRSSGAYRPH
jgi:hypothetical protein